MSLPYVDREESYDDSEVDKVIEIQGQGNEIAKNKRSAKTHRYTKYYPSEVSRIIHDCFPVSFSFVAAQWEF